MNISRDSNVSMSINKSRNNCFSRNINFFYTSIIYYLTTSKLERDIFYHFPIYLEAYNKIEDHGRDPLFRTRPGSVIISGEWKLHHYFEDDGTELYNLKTDIAESNDLSDKEPEITKRLKQSLENWRLKENAFIPNEKNPFYNSIF